MLGMAKPHLPFVFLLPSYNVSTVDDELDKGPSPLCVSSSLTTRAIEP